MACQVISVKKIIPILILVSLTISVITIMSQHITFAQIFLPFNNNNITNPPQNETIMNQNTPAMNQTTPAINSPLLSYNDPTFKFKISYPSNLTKYGVLNLNIRKTTNIGHESLGEVAFGLPKSSGTFLTISFGKEPGNFLLKDYVSTEINLLSRYMGFKQVESTPMSLGGNPAHRIVYVYSIVKNGAEVNQGKSMEIITISNSWPIFVEYRGSLSDYQKYLPLAQKIIDSFQFT
ncbi:MAG: hypothetical protein WA395_07775 [Nitrososphaeraceae archaeon]